MIVESTSISTSTSTLTSSTSTSSTSITLTSATSTLTTSTSTTFFSYSFFSYSSFSYSHFSYFLSTSHSQSIHVSQKMINHVVVLKNSINIILDIILRLKTRMTKLKIRFVAVSVRAKLENINAFEKKY